MTERDVVDAAACRDIFGQRAVCRLRCAVVCVYGEDIDPVGIFGGKVLGGTEIKARFGERPAVDCRILVRKIKAGQLARIEYVYIVRKVGAAVAALFGIRVVVAGAIMTLQSGYFGELGFYERDCILCDIVAVKKVARNQQKVELIVAAYSVIDVNDARISFRRTSAFCRSSADSGLSRCKSAQCRNFIMLNLRCYISPCRVRRGEYSYNNYTAFARLFQVII